MNRMEMKKKKAVIATQLIWLVNIIIITNIMKDNGIAYLAAALEVYMIIITLTVYVLPDAMAKLIRTRMMKGQYHNADMIFKSAVMLGIIMCAIVGIVLFFFSDLLIMKMTGSSYGAITLRMLIPAYILTVIAQTFRGYFQGMGTFVPTGVSKLLEQVLILGSSIFICFLFRNYGKKVSALLQNDNFTEAYGALGIGAGMVVALIFTVLFLILIYLSYRKGGRKQINRESTRGNETFGQGSTLILVTIVPYLLIEISGRLVSFIGLLFYHQLSPKANAAAFGAYYGKYMALVMAVVWIMAWFLIPMENGVITCAKKEEYKNAKEKLQLGVHWICIVGFFIVVYHAVLAEHIIKILYHNDNSVADKLLPIGAVVIVFAAFAVFFTHILYELGKINTIIINGFLSLAVYIAAVMVLFRFAKVDITGLVYGTILYTGVLAIINGLSTFKQLKTKINWLGTVGIPLGTAAISGLIMKLLSYALRGLLGNGITGVICLAIGILSNAVLLLSLRGVHENELEQMPAGKVIIRVAKVVHLL